MTLHAGTNASAQELFNCAVAAVLVLQLLSGLQRRCIEVAVYKIYSYLAHYLPPWLLHRCGFRAATRGVLASSQDLPAGANGVLVHLAQIRRTELKNGCACSCAGQPVGGAAANSAGHYKGIPKPLKLDNNLVARAARNKIRQRGETEEYLARRALRDDAKNFAQNSPLVQRLQSEQAQRAQRLEAIQRLAESEAHAVSSVAADEYERLMIDAVTEDELKAAEAFGKRLKGSVYYTVDNWYAAHFRANAAEDDARLARMRRDWAAAAAKQQQAQAAEAVKAAAEARQVAAAKREAWQETANLIAEGKSKAFATRLAAARLADFAEAAALAKAEYSRLAKAALVARLQAKAADAALECASETASRTRAASLEAADVERAAAEAAAAAEKAFHATAGAEGRAAEAAAAASASQALSEEEAVIALEKADVAVAAAAGSDSAAENDSDAGSGEEAGENASAAAGGQGEGPSG